MCQQIGKGSFLWVPGAVHWRASCLGTILDMGPKHSLLTALISLSNGKKNDAKWQIEGKSSFPGTSEWSRHQYFRTVPSTSGLMFSQVWLGQPKRPVGGLQIYLAFILELNYFCISQASFGRNQMWGGLKKTKMKFIDYYKKKARDEDVSEDGWFQILSQCPQKSVSPHHFIGFPLCWLYPHMVAT